MIYIIYHNRAKYVNENTTSRLDNLNQFIHRHSHRIHNCPAITRVIRKPAVKSGDKSQIFGTIMKARY